MKTRLVRALGIVLAAGMFVGSIDSFAAEAEALSNQKEEILGASETSDGDEKGEGVEEELFTDCEEADGSETSSESMEETEETETDNSEGNMASAGGDREIEPEGSREEGISASEKEETGAENSNGDEIPMDDAGEIENENSQEDEFPVDSMVGVESESTERASKPDENIRNEAGTEAIEGGEYEIDLDIGERIKNFGFENYGIVCNVAADTSYTYKAATCDDSSITTEGTAVFAYNTFYSDDTHPEKEGYTWKQVVITLTFDDVNAHVYGCRTNTLFGLDYYIFDNPVIKEPSSESIIEGEKTVLFNDEEYPVTIRHEVLRSEWGDDCAYHMDICIECHVPTEYDGMVIVLYHAKNVEAGNYEMDLLDKDSLIFRME